MDKTCWQRVRFNWMILIHSLFTSIETQCHHSLKKSKNLRFCPCLKSFFFRSMGLNVLLFVCPCGLAELMSWSQKLSKTDAMCVYIYICVCVCIHMDLWFHFLQILCVGRCWHKTDGLWCLHGIYRSKFRRQTSNNMGRWKSRGGKSQRRERKKKEGQRRERVRRKKIQVREKVEKPRNFAFFQWLK